MTTRGVPWDRLDDLVPDALDDYWQLTLRFLKIARETWPKILAERGTIEPAARRDALIEAEAARLAANTDGPVIAAGSTGSMPATAELIATIAKLPHGAVVLPGLDTDLDAESWELIAGRRDAAGRELIAPAVGHPQFAMQALLRRIGIAREEVAVLGRPPRTDASAWSRRRCGRPSPPTAGRRLARLRFPGARRARVRNPLGDRSRQCRGGGARDRGRVARSGRDGRQDRRAGHARPRAGAPRARRARALERRGRRFRRRCAPRHAGRHLRAARGGGGARRLAPVTLLALLKHPLIRLGAPEGAIARGSRLERAVLRGPRPGRAAPGSPTRSRRSAPSSASSGAGNHPTCIRPIRASLERAASSTPPPRWSSGSRPRSRRSKAGAPRSFADIAARHREVVAA